MDTNWQYSNEEIKLNAKYKILIRANFDALANDAAQNAEKT